MKERPILFSGDMVRALLSGRKTQTRRIVKSERYRLPYDADTFKVTRHGIIKGDCEKGESSFMPLTNRYGIRSDKLWVKETFREWHESDNQCGCSDHCSCSTKPTTEYCYRADGHQIDDEDRALGIKWKPSIFMPRHASRLTLQLVNVRIERLNDISEQDAMAEGIDNNCSHINDCDCYPGEWLNYLNDDDGFPCYSPIDSYRTLWEKINGEGSWNENPWVWVVEFKQINTH